MTGKRFHAKTRSAMILVLISITLFGSMRVSGLWSPVHQGSFNGTYVSQKTANAGSSSRAQVSCDEPQYANSGIAKLRAKSGNGFGYAMCKYTNDRTTNGYYAKAGYVYKAYIDFQIKGYAHATGTAVSKLNVTLQLYYTDGSEDGVVLSSKSLLYYSNNDYDQSASLGSDIIEVNVNTQLYIRVLVEVHAEDGGWGQSSEVEFMNGDTYVDLGSWTLYEYYMTGIY